MREQEHFQVLVSRLSEPSDSNNLAEQLFVVACECSATAPLSADDEHSVGKADARQ